MVFVGAILVLSCAAYPKAGGGRPFDHTASPVPTSSVDLTGSPAIPTSETREVGSDLTPPVPTRSPNSPTSEAIPIYTYRIVNVYPHDPDAFTQGLVFGDGLLYEGTGQWGQSTLRKVELESGDVLQLYALSYQCFGEGITIYGDNVIQLTWKSRIGFVYDKDSLALLQTFTYPTEGWGITHDGTYLIVSDGTSTLHFWDPETFEEVYQLRVYDSQGPVTRLNELEYIQGRIYANVWLGDRIAIIDPQTGQVTGWIDLTGLLGPEDRTQSIDVLNGIAYDAEGGRLFVTGKLWPKLFEIELIPPQHVFLLFVGR